MNLEIEVKFLDVNHDEIREKLRALGGICLHPMRLMRRVAIDNEFMRTGKDSFLRIRDEGHRATMTYKQYDDATVDGTKEIEIEVSDYDAAVALMEQVGLKSHTVQVTRRENWKVGDVEVMLDEWPWLKPYIEIEGESEKALHELAEKLGFNWEDAVFGDVMAAYRAEYPHLGLNDTVATVAIVDFDEPLPEILKGHTS